MDIFGESEGDSTTFLESITCREVAQSGSSHWRAGFSGDLDGQVAPISPWDDIPLFGADMDTSLVHCVCKTPAGLWTRLEVAEEENFHPLRLCQGTPALGSQAGGHEPNAGNLGAGALLHYADNAPWNIGFLPQTARRYGMSTPTVRATTDMQSCRQDLMSLEAGTSKGGKPEKKPRQRQRWQPNEIIEIGAETQRSLGDVYLVKPLGAFMVEVEGEQELKIIAIAECDPMARVLHGMDDVRKWLPRCKEQVREWLRTCNLSNEGVKESVCLNEEEPMTVDATNVAILRSHLRWQTLRYGISSFNSLPLQPNSKPQTHSSTPVGLAGLPPHPRNDHVPSSIESTLSNGGLLPGEDPRSRSLLQSLDVLPRIPISNPELSLFDASWTSPAGSVVGTSTAGALRHSRSEGVRPAFPEWISHSESELVIPTPSAKSGGMRSGVMQPRTPPKGRYQFPAVKRQPSSGSLMALSRQLAFISSESGNDSERTGDAKCSSMSPSLTPCLSPFISPSCTPSMSPSRSPSKAFLRRPHTLGRRSSPPSVKDALSQGVKATNLTSSQKSRSLKSLVRCHSDKWQSGQNNDRNNASKSPCASPSRSRVFPVGNALDKSSWEDHAGKENSRNPPFGDRHVTALVASAPTHTLRSHTGELLAIEAEHTTVSSTRPKSLTQSQKGRMKSFVRCVSEKVVLHPKSGSDELKEGKADPFAFCVKPSTLQLSKNMASEAPSPGNEAQQKPSMLLTPEPITTSLIAKDDLVPSTTVTLTTTGATRLSASSSNMVSMVGGESEILQGVFVRPDTLRERAKYDADTLVSSPVLGSQAPKGTVGLHALGTDPVKDKEEAQFSFFSHVDNQFSADGRPSIPAHKPAKGLDASAFLTDSQRRQPRFGRYRSNSTSGQTVTVVQGDLQPAKAKVGMLGFLGKYR
eukprot:TRINITY_DN2572_c0_g1_i3.p1 TRINITY_DN2572_c0_g1~~TRINITY_DN2572_c0_g1_i3.p1  ORF type:complete len:920 (+),score=48.44 TRINITY_DN2572_c0_g1_i3:1917-4676(+)